MVAIDEISETLVWADLAVQSKDPRRTELYYERVREIIPELQNLLRLRQHSQRISLKQMSNPIQYLSDFALKDYNETVEEIDYIKNLINDSHVYLGTAKEEVKENSQDAAWRWN